MVVAATLLLFVVDHRCIPFFICSGIPILTGDHDYEQQQQGGEQDDYLPSESAAVHDISKRADFDTDDYAEVIPIDGDGGEINAHLIRKRQTWVFVTHNTLTNDSQYREFKFEQVCVCFYFNHFHL